MPPTTPPVRILSWNVNGIRAAAKKGFAAWLDGCGAEIVGLQEVRAARDKVPADLAAPDGWHLHLVEAERAGYSGVALYTRRPPEQIDTSLGESRFDREGRVQIARFGRLVLANVYFPNGSGKDRDNGRVPFKLDFYRSLYDRLDRMRRGGYRVLVMGDFNTAHREIDLARPKGNQKTSGFLPEERAEVSRWIAGGWIDAFRRYEQGADHYTWWSQRYGVREKNVGWRIDYVLASKAAMRHVAHAFHQPEVMGSDHCPVGVDVNPSIFGG